MNLYLMFSIETILIALIIFLIAYIKKKKIGEPLLILSITSNKPAIISTSIQFFFFVIMTIICIRKILTIDIVGILAILLVGIYAGIELSKMLMLFLNIGIYENGAVTNNGIIYLDEIDYTYSSKLQNQDLHLVGFVKFIKSMRMRYTFYVSEDEKKQIKKLGKMFSTKVKL